MARGFNVARRTGTTVPRTQSVAVTAAQTFKAGALVLTTAAGTISECGADPTAVRGIALQDAFTGPGYDVSDASKTVVFTGRPGECVVAIADDEQEFSARGVNGGTDPVIPLQTHIDEQYGVVKVGNDWCIDFTETTTKVVQITDIATEDNSFLCKFIDTVRQVP